jgi:acetate kinase
MDTILVVNAGSSSVKFQIFGIEGAGALHRLIKGQIDGIGTRPRLTAQASDKSSLINRTYASNEVPDVPAAIAVVAAWLRDEAHGCPGPALSRKRLQSLSGISNDMRDRFPTVGFEQRQS